MLVRPTSTRKIADSVYAIRTAISNFYIINTGKSLIAFDTGMNPYLCKKGFEELELNPDLVSHVFLTHSDYDHVGGLKLFKNAKVYLSKKEEPMVTGQKARLLIKYNTRLHNYQTLEDRQLIKVGNCNIQIISTPGHTPGSSCYLINDKILASGDTLRTSTSGQVTPFLFFQNMSHSGDKHSLNKLQTEGIIERSTLILTGHTGVLEKHASSK